MLDLIYSLPGHLAHRTLFTRWWTVLPQKFTCTARGVSLLIMAGAAWRLPEVLGFIVSQVRTRIHFLLLRRFPSLGCENEEKGIISLLHWGMAYLYGSFILRVSWEAALHAAHRFLCHPRGIACVAPKNTIYPAGFGGDPSIAAFLSPPSSCPPFSSFMPVTSSFPPGLCSCWVPGPHSSMIVWKLWPNGLLYTPALDGFEGNISEHLASQFQQFVFKWLYTLTPPACFTLFQCLSRSALPLQYWIQTALKPSRACRLFFYRHFPPCLCKRTATVTHFIFILVFSLTILFFVCAIPGYIESSPCTCAKAAQC